MATARYWRSYTYGDSSQTYVQVTFVTTLLVAGLLSARHDARGIKNWKWLEKKWSWPNRGTITRSAGCERRKSRKLSVMTPVYSPRFKPRISRVWVQSVNSLPTRSSSKLLFQLQGGVSNYATNGSKTDVLDVKRFPCVSLGSSTVQLHDSLGNRCACACSDAGSTSQNSDRAWGVY
jgi:hypothetical protein